MNREYAVIWKRDVHQFLLGCTTNLNTATTLMFDHFDMEHSGCYNTMALMAGRDLDDNTGTVYYVVDLKEADTCIAHLQGALQPGTDGLEYAGDERP